MLVKDSVTITAVLRRIILRESSESVFEFTGRNRWLRSCVTEQFRRVVNQSVSVSIQNKPCVVTIGRRPSRTQNCPVSIVKVDAMFSISQGKTVSIYVDNNRRPTVSALAGAINTALVVATSAGLAHA